MVLEPPESQVVQIVQTGLFHLLTQVDQVDQLIQCLLLNPAHPGFHGNPVVHLNQMNPSLLPLLQAHDCQAVHDFHLDLVHLLYQLHLEPLYLLLDLVSPGSLGSL